MSDNYRKDSKEYCRREEKSKPTSCAYKRASTFALEAPKIGASDRQLRLPRAAPATGCPSNMEAELEPEAEEAWQGNVVGETAPAEPVMMEEEAVPVEAEAESEPVGASEVVPEVVEGEEDVVTEEPRGWLSSLLGPRLDCCAEPGDATVDEVGGVLPGGPWAESAVDPRVTEEKGGVMRLEAKLRARDGSLKDASVTFKPGDRFYNWDGGFKKKRKSPPPEELYTGPRDDGLLSTDEISGDYSASGFSRSRDGCWQICGSMTVVPLGANTIEIGHSGCVFIPCVLCLGPMADGEARTRNPGTNEFRHWNVKGNVMTFSADGTVKLDADESVSSFKKRPNSQKRAFRKVETKDLEGKWCVCCCIPLLPFLPFSAVFAVFVLFVHYEEGAR